MSTFSLTMEKFPKGWNGVYIQSVTEKALIRGAIAAGSNPRQRPRTLDAIAHQDFLAAIVRSSLDTTSPHLKSTDHFNSMGATDKGQKCLSIGNALCAHCAYAKLSIPWLFNIEKLPSSLVVGFRNNSKKRADFIGLDNLGQWHVFESKGRSTKPCDKKVKQWKGQARSVRTINGGVPCLRIVSSTYLSSNKTWNVVWRDPPPERGIDVNISIPAFFDLVYHDVFNTLVAALETDNINETEFGPVVRLPKSGVSIGLHRSVLKAIVHREYLAILQFSKDFILPSRDTENEHLSLFPDGIIVRIDSGGDGHSVFGPTGTKAKIPVAAQSTPLTPSIGAPLFPQPERATQDRVIALFCQEMGYRYLGDWSERSGNGPIDDGLLSASLAKSGHTPAQVAKALHTLHTEAGNPNRSLYENNRKVYGLLRYGVPVKTEAGQAVGDGAAD
jgi:hypothetical protein